jgi:peptide/nickel transport system ATP-binding protein
MRVGRQIVEAIQTHTGLRGAAARERALQWLERVGIPEPGRRLHSYPFELSGGQKQRVMIAMALACEPDFLVADEPTTALDVTIQAQILDLLRQLQRERGMGLLLITHDLAVVSTMAHRVALMYAGQIVEEADSASFFRTPAHPYAHLLLQALPEVSKRGQPLGAIRGQVPALWERFAGCRFAPRCPKAQDRCRTQTPPLEPQGGVEHPVRCWFAQPAHDAPAAPAPPPVTAPATTFAAAMAQAPAPGAVPPKAGQDIALSIESLRVTFSSAAAGGWGRRHQVTAVDGVSLQLPAGRTLALVGESGCGKTTLGRAVMQLLRRTAHVEGRAIMGGQDLFGLKGDALMDMRRRLQIVFQDPFASLNPRLRVQDILEEGLLSLRADVHGPQRSRRMTQALEQVGLNAQALQRYPHEFSGGQRQRIAIARALVVEPQLLICDEPTSALDVSVQAQILNLLKDLQQRLHLTMLFITHNIGAVSYLADEIAVMHRGRIVETGPAQQVIEAPTQDYTKALLAAVPVLERGHRR